jgi:hypothetical protein
MVGFKGSTQEKSIFEIFRFRLKKSPHDKKVPDRVGSGLMFGGGDAVFDKLFEIAKVTPQPVEGDGRGELNIRGDLHFIESDRALIKPSNLPNGDAQKGKKVQADYDNFSLRW